MSKFTLSNVKEYFDVNRKELSGIMLLLLYMKPGDYIKTEFGLIRKIEANDFRIEVTTETMIENLLEEWSGTNTEELYGFSND